MQNTKGLLFGMWNEDRTQKQIDRDRERVIERGNVMMKKGDHKMTSNDEMTKKKSPSIIDHENCDSERFHFEHCHSALDALDGVMYIEQTNRYKNVLYGID